MYITLRYRLLPSKRQHRALESILEGQRQLYNAGPEERIDAFRKAGLARTYFDQCKALTEWRKGDEEAACLPVALQRWSLKRLDEAYRGFFRRIGSGVKPGFPRFRGRGRFNSFGFAQFAGIRFESGRIRFCGMPGSLRVHLHRPPCQEAMIRSCVFRVDDKGWSVGFVVRVPELQLKRRGRAVGIDLGLTKFAALSDGEIIPNLRAARNAERRLRTAQRAMARKVRGSGNRRKALRCLRRCHARIARARRNHLHQASRRIVRDYDVVAIEKLNIRGLARGPLAKDVHDAGWATFISMLRYKAACAGTRLVEVDPRGTSQECSSCGMTVQKGLDVRIHMCPRCGLTIDRDLNAARNILNRAGVGPGLRNVAGCGKRAGGNLNELA
jgi:putative transposase